MKQKLVQATVLAYPNFEWEIVLERDASVKGIGAVLLQQLDYGRLHPVAYASRSLSIAVEKLQNYRAGDPSYGESCSAF